MNFVILAVGINGKYIWAISDWALLQVNTVDSSFRTSWEPTRTVRGIVDYTDSL